MSPRVQLIVGDLAKCGQWRMWRSLSVIISCPLCGQRISVENRNYHITDGGEVKPAVECPGEDCGFFDYVILAGWTGS